MNFGDRLKIVRMSRELSVDELATLANLTAKKIRQIERRGDRPSLPTVKRISAALNVKPALLLGVTK